jgi:hypothetical protein
MGRQECRVLPGPAQSCALLPQRRRDATPVLDSNSLFVFKPLREETSVQRIDELSFHHAFIGPIRS